MSPFFHSNHPPILFKVKVEKADVKAQWCKRPLRSQTKERSR